MTSRFGLASVFQVSDLCPCHAQFNQAFTSAADHSIANIRQTRPPAGGSARLFQREEFRLCGVKIRA